jgi:hypothetical protein
MERTMIIKDMEHYEKMRDSGASPEEIYCDAMNKYGKDASFMYLMRHIFHVSIQQARQLIHSGEECWYQEYILPRYRVMRNNDATPHEIYLTAKLQETDDPFICLRVLSSLFDLNQFEFKEVIIQANGLANSLKEHQEAVAVWVRMTHVTFNYCSTPSHQIHRTSFGNTLHCL